MIVGFHYTHCKFRKVIGCLEFLIQSQTQSRGVFVGELDCLHLVFLMNVTVHMCQKRCSGNMCKSGSSLIENYVESIKD